MRIHEGREHGAQDAKPVWRLFVDGRAVGTFTRLDGAVAALLINERTRVAAQLRELANEWLAEGFVTGADAKRRTLERVAVDLRKMADAVEAEKTEG